jgi:hypothetical protein
MAATTDSDPLFHAVGVTVAVGLHVGLALVIFGLSQVGSRHDAERKSPKDLRHIEAGLARRSQIAGGKASALPSKTVTQKAAPRTNGVASNAERATDPTHRPDDKTLPPGAIDVNAVMNQYRPGQTDEGTQTGDEGSGAENVPGDPNGSKLGNLDKAKGDPYVGELIGRMSVDFVVPSAVPEGKGLETWGCVRLSPDGKIAERMLDPEHKSPVHAFNSAVEDRLGQTTDMEQPVPDDLTSLLVDQFACHVYTY